LIGSILYQVGINIGKVPRDRFNLASLILMGPITIVVLLLSAILYIISRIPMIVEGAFNHYILFVEHVGSSIAHALVPAKKNLGDKPRGDTK